jgi:hypothetical protein
LEFCTACDLTVVGGISKDELTTASKRSFLCRKTVWIAAWISVGATPAGTKLCVTERAAFELISMLAAVTASLCAGVAGTPSSLLEDVMLFIELTTFIVSAVEVLALATCRAVLRRFADAC